MGLFSFFGSTPPPAPEEKAGSAELVEIKATPTDRPPGAPGAEAQQHSAPKFDGVGVLAAAGLDDKERERVERALELLNVLPSETPPQLRKTIVEASLKAFDVSIRAIVQSATAQVAAYEAYVDHGQKELADLKAQSEARIAELEAEIQRVRKRLDVATADQSALDHSAQAAIDRVRPVLVFFAEPAEAKVANEGSKDHPPSIIIDESLMRAS